MSDYQGILVYCEVSEDKLAAISTELLGAGKRLAGELGQQLSALLIGSNIRKMAQEAIAYGADKVYVVDDATLKDYSTDTYLQVIEKVIKQTMPQIVLLGHTDAGSDLTPRLAFRLDTAAVLDCVAISIAPDTKRMLMTKPVYGGNAESIQICDHNPQIASVRSKVLSPLTKDANRQGQVIDVNAGIDPASVKVRVLERKIQAAAGLKLEDASVVVAGGRGIGSADGFKQLTELAKVLNGAVAASRPPCDNKWVSDNIQIGITGKIVSPTLLFAIGISGSSQCTSGCSGSKVIVSINKDPEANIFKMSHYGIVAEWKKVLPSFTSKVKELVSG